MSHLEKCSGCPICELIKAFSESSSVSSGNYKANHELKNILVLFEEEKDNIRILNKNLEQDVGMQCIILALAMHQKDMPIGGGYKNDKEDFTLTVERLTKDIYAVSFFI